MLTTEALAFTTTVVWTATGGSTTPDAFLNRHPVLFLGWSVWHRIALLRAQGWTL